MSVSSRQQESKYLEIDVKKLDCPSSNLTPRDKIGYYSFDINRKFKNSNESLRHFIRPSNLENVNFDLKRGYEESKPAIKAHGNDLHILSWIKENMEIISTDRKLNTDFVCRRGVLTRIMLTPYEGEEEWCVKVALYNGTYYIKEMIPKNRKKSDDEVRSDEDACWGWKFEQYLTADCRNGTPKTDGSYNNSEAFYSVVKTGLNNHTLVLSGEIDAINNDGEYMEFKTNKEFEHDGHKETFKRHKTKKWWAQSHLTGVKEIVCGFKSRDGNEKGVVKRLEIFKTEELPCISSDIGNPWKTNVCINFLDQFLSFVKSSIKNESVSILKWTKSNGGGRVECRPYSFLPQCYIDATS